MPCRITHLERAHARRRDRHLAAARGRASALPRRAVPGVHDRSRGAPLLLDRHGAACGRGDQYPRAPHAGGSLHDALFGAAAKPIKERDILRLEGPLGTFFLRPDSERPIVLLASGTGFAPIKAIAETIFHLQLNHDDPGRTRPARSVALYWGARARRDLYMNDLPMRWAGEQPNFRYIPVLSDALEEDAWTGRTGFVHQAVMQDLPDLSQHEVYACGAPAMVEAARRDFVHLCGLSDDHFLPMRSRPRRTS